MRFEPGDIVECNRDSICFDANHSVYALNKGQIAFVVSCTECEKWHLVELLLDGMLVEAYADKGDGKSPYVLLRAV